MKLSSIAVGAVALILLKWAAQLWLDELNRRSARENAGKIPAAFRDVMDEATYAKSVAYTLAKGGLHRLELTYDTIILFALLLSGVLPWSYEWMRQALGSASWAMATYLWLVGLTLSLTSLPIDWYHQFHLEARFGFNTSTVNTWWMDRLKALLLGVVLGYPLLWLVLQIVVWTGPRWWLWAWAALMAFQLLLSVLAPVLILPLFNKLTPLPEGTLRERLLALAERTRFRARSIQVMDGSKRSRHSNAFFTGFGRLRKIVLFDTLIEQLSEPELEAVLAHEIGHFKKKHIPKTLVLAAIGSLAAFGVVAWLAGQNWFYRGFGFEPGSIVPALLLFALLSGVVTFWASPVANWWSRRNEYEADAFAAQVMNNPQPLVSALRRLNVKNLSNLTPHPVYSGFYYSHPTLVERERALLIK